MSDLKTVFDPANLKRAYRWILSSPDASYKSYFRDSYDAFAIASETHLKWIRNECLKDRYQPTHATKIFTPKPSGLLRPITLLTVEDQIVYQACVNVIAEALRKKTQNRYHKRVFAHLYAGKRSRFFYFQWQRSYRNFAKRIKKAYADGYRHIADFDLAAFYDSIDHHVLKHFLQDTGIDEDTIEFLLSCLRHWTSSTWSTGPSNIYLGHGIPQGPLASGMLSEVVLQHIDAAGEQGRKTLYLRYVDDIKILAKNEDELRGKLIKLDITSKEIGLFPQTAKINIHRMTDPREEVKSVSQPPEPSVVPKVDQKKLISRLLELTRRGKVDPKKSSRFKYLLGQTVPSHRMNSRLMVLLKVCPEFSPSICSYISRYEKVPEKLAEEIIEYVKGRDLYHSVHGAILRSCLGRLSPSKASVLGRFCATRLLRAAKGSIPPQPTYKEALIAWCLSAGTISFAEYEHIVFQEKDWWVRKCAIGELSIDLFGASTYADFINRLMRIQNGETSRISASRLVQDDVKLVRPYRDVETTGKQTLKAAKIVRAVGQPDSRINEILAYIFKRRKTNYDWKTLLGKDHQHAERMAIFIKRNRESNIDAFLVQLDSFCDFLTGVIYPRFKPGKIYPFYGSALQDPTLIGVLPATMMNFRKLHNIRLESMTAHPTTKKTGKPTRRLKHNDFYKIRMDLIAAFDEFERLIRP